MPLVPKGARLVAHWVYVDPAHDHAVNVLVHHWQDRYLFSRHDSALCDREGQEIAFRSVIPATEAALRGETARLEGELSQLGPYLKGAAGGLSLTPIAKPTDPPRPPLPFAGVPVTSAGDAMTLHAFLSSDRRWLVVLAEAPDNPASALIAFLFALADGETIGEEVILHAKATSLHRAVLLRWYHDFTALDYRVISREEELEVLVPGGMAALVDEVRPRVEWMKSDLRDAMTDKDGKKGQRRVEPQPVAQEARDVSDVLKSRYMQSLYERYLPPQVTPWAIRRSSVEEIQTFMRRVRKRFSNHHQHNLSIVEAALLAEAEVYRNGSSNATTTEGFRLVRLVREAGANLAAAAPA